MVSLLKRRSARRKSSFTREDNQLFHQQGVENLESRRMLAGNVSAVVSRGGDLNIHGDNADNNFVVHGTGVEGDLFIEGKDGTTINGQASLTVSGVSDDVRVMLRRGNDNFLLTGVPEGSSVAGTIDFIDDVFVTGAAGNDAITIEGITNGGNVTVLSGSGNDAIGLAAMNVDNITLLTGSGDDAVGMPFAVKANGNTFIAMGAGNDVVSISGGTTGFLQTNFEGNFTVFGGGGDDGLAVDGANFHGGHVYLGGGGQDQMQVGDASYAFLPLVLGVEQSGNNIDSVVISPATQPAVIGGLTLWFQEGLGQFFV